MHVVTEWPRQMQVSPPKDGTKPSTSVTSVTRIGQGLVSCLQVQDVQQHADKLQSICLHGNNIARIEGLERLTAVRELNLSSNAITQVEGLQTLSNLTSLNLASNRLSGALGSLAGLSSLTHLNLAYNGLTSLAGIAELQGTNSKLRILNVRQNLIGSLQQLAVLAGCMGLRELSVAGNPISQLPNHRQAILNVLPHITQLDNLTGDPTVAANAFDAKAAQNLAAMKLQAYQPPLSPAPAPAPLKPPMQPATDPSRSPLRTRNPNTPAIDTALAQHQARMRPQPPSSPHLAPQQQYSGTPMVYPAAAGPRHTANWQSAAATARHTQGQTRTQGVTYEPQLGAGGGESVGGTAAVQRVYLRDSAVQVSDQSDKALKKLRQECDQLKQQLLHLTNELEERNRKEEDLRQQMTAAIQAIEEEAHKRVEEGYREASQAVQKALGEVDVSRRAMAEVQERAAVLTRREGELQKQVAALDRDLAKCKEECARLTEAHKNEAQVAAQATDTARQRLYETEQQLRQELQAAERDLSATKAALAASEQRATSLEAAVQQANAVSVTMTQRIAQTMAESTAQVDALKARLATAEQSLTDASRREAELRAEVSMLTANVTAMQQRHAQDVQTARQQATEEARKCVASEVAAAEERARNAVQATANQERTQLQEQLAYLKAQLQFALKEGDKETALLQEQLAQSQQQLSELQLAAQQSLAKQREHEALVNDLGNVVSQQKTHIQALQKDRESLSAQLRAAAPDQVQRLQSEVSSLRAVAAEVTMVKEQADHSRKQWQESEKRLAELEASSVRKQEELSQRCQGLEAALGTARQEAKQAQAQLEALSMQLSAAEDALKVKKAMLDSANETIASLKAEVSDLGLELEDARRAVEETELAAQRQAEADAQEKANLRAEVEAGEAALEAMSSSASSADARVAAADAKAREHEARCKTLEKQLADKEELIKYVEEEVERVKGLYEKRESRLREERDAARAAASAAQAAQEALEARVADQATKVDLLSTELQAEREAAQSASAACQRAQEENTQLAARLADTENELRSLLAAVERQKASSAVKMRQLATLLSDMG